MLWVGWLLEKEYLYSDSRTPQSIKWQPTFDVIDDLITMPYILEQTI